MNPGDQIALFLLTYRWVFYLLLIWTMVWKGWALWRASRNNHLVWFIALLVINTLGILEILYLFIWGRKKEKEREKKEEIEIESKES